MVSFSAMLRTIPALLAASAALAQGVNTQWPLHTDGLTNLVEWDHYSFTINGQRLFIFSGEFHYWRLPVPELWKDLLEKAKAAGFNAFSIYSRWGYHEASPGVLDFETGAHNFTRIMELAKELGMYMIVRPGPYVNAETNAGGFPLWLTTGAYGQLRTSDPLYTNAYTPYWANVSEVFRPHLITNGGNVVLYQIENELNGQFKNFTTRTPNPPIDDYMQDLENAARANGINVPFTYNAPNMFDFSWSKDVSNVTGDVDVVGLDSYPSCWTCNISQCTSTNGEYVAYQVVDYLGYFERQSPTQPNFMPEFQGGSYNPWGGPQGGCPNDIGADFANLFYRDLIYQRVTAVSLYMLYGGTNWGWLAAPEVASSYDYSSPVSENRVIGSKYYETKLLTLFTRAARDLPKTDMIGNGTSYTDNAAITTSELRNPDTNAGFYVTLHAYSPSDTLETFKLNVNTSEGLFAIPRYGGSITINGHQAKVLVTDFNFGCKTLLYSTAEVLTYAVIDQKNILVLWLPAGESGEFAISGATSGKATAIEGSASTASSVRFYPGSDNITVSYTQAAGMTVVDLDDGTRVVLLDRSVAYTFWVPTLSNDPMAPANDTVLVQGPYLVRSAVMNTTTHTLELTGDSASNGTALYVFAPKSACSVSWNGKKLAITATDGGLLKAELAAPGTYQLPALGPWTTHDSLPEISMTYNASGEAWVDANETTTPNPFKPAPNNPVLYVDDYGIHYGNHIYRATFPSTPTPPTGVYLNISGGTAFGYSAWLNSQYIGSYLGLSYSEIGAINLSFANATLRTDGEDNILVVVMDNSGHEEQAAAVDPRGITNATLLGPSSSDGAGYAFSSWKIAGTAGRQRNIDPIRGPLNEGGLYAERIGAHLPGFPDSNWTTQPSTPLSVPGAGIKVFRTVVPLHVPDGLDVSVSFQLTAPGPSGNLSSSNATFAPTVPGYSNRVRALLFVNGYQYGRFNPYIGNQIDFPVPPGILDYDGDNTVVVTVWSQSAEGAEIKVDWDLDYVHSSSFDMKFNSTYLRPGWTSSRWAYA